MIFVASWALSARIYSFFQRCAPSNVVLHRVYTRAGLKWGWLAGIAGVIVYGSVLVIGGTVVRDGEPGWVNLVLIGFWNMIRFAFLIPVSVIHLLRVRHFKRVVAQGAVADPAAVVGPTDQRLVVR